MLFGTLLSSVRCIRSNVLRTQNIPTLMRTQKYSPWMHRRPAAVVNEEIVLDDAEEVQPRRRKYVETTEEERRALKPRPRKGHRPLKRPPPTYKTDNTYKEDGTLNITKLAEDDRILTTLMMTLKSRKLRERNNYLLLEGHRLISDALQVGLKAEIIIFSRTSDIMKLQLPEWGVKLYKVPYQTIQLWSNLTTTPGIIGIFVTPESFEKEMTANSIPLTIICDNVREPGNLGSILRAAAGVGCERVILTKGCVDVWEPKVLRSAAGAHFRVSISKSVSWKGVRSLLSPMAKIFAADNNATVNSAIASDVPIADEETGTISDDEGSLSCSASDDEKSSEKTEEEWSANDVVDENVESDEKSEVRAEQVDLKELASKIPIMPYYDVDYTTNEVVVIVGGETEGLSRESVELLREKQGVRVNVPLTNDVESLNTGMALGIVAFEVRRQFATKTESGIK